jgi:hypothetical protein
VREVEKMTKEKEIIDRKTVYWGNKWKFIK